jgi:hypothetical protein
MTDREVIQALRSRIEEHSVEPDWGSESDALLFLGNWHDSIPRALTLDPILEAVDVRVYLLLRTLIHAQGLNRFPNYDEIQRLLNLSRPTVARCLLILRAARWISLCNSLRDGAGRFRGNVYAVHDEVLPLADAIALDGRYLEFLEGIEQHHHPRVALVAQAVLETIRHAVRQQEEAAQAPSALTRFTQGVFAASTSHVQRINAQPESTDLVQELNSASPVQKLNSAYRVKKLNSNTPVQNLNSESGHPVHILNSDGEPSQNQKDTESGKILNSGGKIFNSATTTCSSCLNKKTTTASNNVTENTPHAPTREAPENALSFPPGFGDDERRLALGYLQAVDTDYHQALLDELAAQIQAKQRSSKPIRNALGYLHWMCERLQEGQSPLTSLGVAYRQTRGETQSHRPSKPPETRTGKPIEVARLLARHMEALKASVAERRTGDAE